MATTAKEGSSRANSSYDDFLGIPRIFSDNLMVLL